MALINDFLSLIYPRSCEACRNSLFKHEKLLCNYCRINLPRSNFHRNTNNPLTLALGGRIPFLNAFSYLIFEKSGKVQSLLHAIKYQSQVALAEELGRIYAKELLMDDCGKNIHYIIPVPLHEKKLKQRGFNQSEHFARGLSEILNVPLQTQSLKRSAYTSTQTRKKKYERWENVEGVFELRDKDQFQNKHVLLVDDVITTGATLEAAWQCMKDVEGIKISVGSIAFAAKN